MRENRYFVVPVNIPRPVFLGCTVCLDIYINELMVCMAAAAFLYKAKFR